MKQDSSSVRILNEQVSVIDKITVPPSAVAAFAEKSGYIRNILRQQLGFVKDEAFQQKDENGHLMVITIVTWENQKHLDNAKIFIQAHMKKAKINMPEFLTQNGIVIERGIYYSVVE
jgi:heme-degrading monooxygenase HmoA